MWPGILIPKLSLYCLASSRPRYIRALPSGTIPFTTWSKSWLAKRKQTFKTYAADLSCNWVSTLVSSAYHHLIDDDLLGSKNNSILADDAYDCATKKKVSEISLTKKKLVENPSPKWVSLSLLTLMSRQPSRRIRPGRFYLQGSVRSTRNQTDSMKKKNVST